jgi:hypothetical protein
VNIKVNEICKTTKDAFKKCVHISTLAFYIRERVLWYTYVSTRYTLKQLRDIIKRGSEVGPLKANPLLQYP